MLLLIDYQLKVNHKVYTNNFETLPSTLQFVCNKIRSEHYDLLNQSLLRNFAIISILFYLKFIVDHVDSDLLFFFLHFLLCYCAVAKLLTLTLHIQFWFSLLCH